MPFLFSFFLSPPLLDYLSPVLATGLFSAYYASFSSYSNFSIFSASFASCAYAYLYNLTKRISLTILTILPALVPTLEARPALAS